MIMVAAKTLLHQSNPISLRTAIVQDDGRLVYFVLLPALSSLPKQRNSAKSSFAPLFQRKKPLLEWILEFFKAGIKNEKNPKQNVTNKAATAHQNKRKTWFFRLSYQYFVASHRRGVKAMTFKKIPDFRIKWSESGHSVALFLNEEPWAFIHEGINYGYSKGVLNAANGNLWDQKLFEKTFNAK